MISDAETVHTDVSTSPEAKMPPRAGSGAGPAASGTAARKRPAAARSVEEEDAKREMLAKVARAKADAKERVNETTKEAKKEMRQRVAEARLNANGSGQPGAATVNDEVKRCAYLRASCLASSFVGACFVMEIFAGCARLSGACVEAGLGVFTPIDNKEGDRPWADVSNPVVKAILMAVIDSGLIWYVHLATPCKLWSGARQCARKVVSTHVVEFTIEILKRVALYNRAPSQRQGQPIYVSIENPDNSLLFELPELRAAMETLKMTDVRYSCCAFGASYQKNSVIWTNAPLQPLARRCADQPAHEHQDALEGKVTVDIDGKRKSVWKTTLSAAYVPDLCRAWATCLKGFAPEGAFRKPGMDPAWQNWLMTATGHDFPLLPSPTCPPAFVAPWADGEPWQVRRKPSAKRPAAASGDN